MDTLADELLCYIVQYISAAKDAFALSATSKHIREVVTSTWGLTHEMRIAGWPKFVSAGTHWTFWRVLLFVSNLQRVDIDMPLCPHLREIVLAGNNGACTRYLANIVRSAPNLQTISLHGSMDARMKNPPAREIMTVLAARDNIKHVTLCSFDLGIIDRYDENALVSNKTLHSLRLYECTRMQSFNLHDLIRDNKKTLSSLSVTKSPDLVPYVVDTLRICGGLTKVDFSECCNLNYVAIESLSYCPLLEEVLIVDCVLLGTQAAVILATRMPRLHTLHFGPRNGQHHSLRPHGLREEAAAAIMSNTKLRDLKIHVTVCGIAYAPYLVDLYRWERKQKTMHPSATILIKSEPCLVMGCLTCAGFVAKRKQAAWH